ncbi:MAG TPA: hypothetical protein VM686_35185 [Polyangiaceae bacterium]|nr:hypothetical protein [Polyangiaceae bacterium]
MPFLELRLTETFAEVLQALRSDAAFRSRFNALLAELPFTAFRWELPALTTASVTRQFECVAVDDPYLARPADPTDFSEHLEHATADVLEFPNLGGDAILVVPCARGEASAYAHLGAFVRGAPPAQRDALWRVVGEATSRRLSAKPVWLSTAGAGVPWLHVRLDDRPKYYAHAAYRAAT